MKIRSRISRLWLAPVLAVVASIGVWAVASAAPSPVTKGASVRQAVTMTVPANTWTYVGDGEPLGVLLLRVGHMALIGQCAYGNSSLVMKFGFEAVGGPVERVTPGSPNEPPNLEYLSPGATGDGSYGNPTDRDADVVIVQGPTENASGVGTFAVMDAKGPTFTGIWADLGDYNHQSCQFTVQVAG